MKPNLGVRAACVALFVAAGVMLGVGVAAAADDLAKALVGTWQGELQLRLKKGADPEVTLKIASVKQEDGKWVAEGRFGLDGKTRPVKIDVDTSGAKPSLRWTGATGFEYNLSLLDDKHLGGTATVTTKESAGRGDRDRSMRLEKKE
jgi:hypothetical protein